MCVCVCVCIYIYIYTYIHTYIKCLHVAILLFHLQTGSFVTIHFINCSAMLLDIPSFQCCIFILYALYNVVRFARHTVYHKITYTAKNQGKHVNHVIQHTEPN